jgi:hypothetical protein
LKQESFSKFPEIVAFGKKLSHSFQAAQVAAAAARVAAVHLMLIQAQVLCGWGAFTDKCGGSVSAAECRAAMAIKGGDVSSRDILNGKLTSGLDALVGLSDEEKLNDNRDFNCLVHDCDFNWVFGSKCVGLLLTAAPYVSGRLGGRDSLHVSCTHAVRSVLFPTLLVNGICNYPARFTHRRYAASVAPEQDAAAVCCSNRLQTFTCYIGPRKRCPAAPGSLTAFALRFSSRPAGFAHHSLVHRQCARAARVRRLSSSTRRLRYRGVSVRDCRCSGSGGRPRGGRRRT